MRLIHSPSVQSEYDRLFWWLLALLLALRMVYAGLFPLDLSGDEAYYWDWGRHPDWGYLSKPPLIGWLMALIREAGLDSAAGIRSVAALLGAGVLVFIFLLGRALFGAGVGFWSAAAMAVTPAHTALSLILTIDAPLMVCWAAALFFFWMYLHGGKHRAVWGLSLALSLGLGLLAKQTMLAFYPLALLYLAMAPERRRWLSSPGLWLILLGGLIGTLPTLWWNHNHQWLTFTHTAQHFTETPFTPLQVVKNLGELAGGQLAIVGPVLLPLLLMAAVASVALRRRPAWRYLFVFGSVPMAAVVALTLRQEVNANWPAPALVTGVILLTAWALQDPPDAARRRWLRLGLAVSLLFSLSAWVMPYLPLQEPVAGRNVDFLKRLRGWERLADRIQQIREAQPDWQDAFLLTHGYRSITSGLAFYLPDRPRVYRWPMEEGRVETQYEVWGLPCGNQGASALVVLTSREGRPQVPQHLRRSFTSLRFLDAIEQEYSAGRRRFIDIWLGEEWRPPCTAPGEKS